jgi:hypothetical protein
MSDTPLGTMTKFFVFFSFAGQLLCSSSWGVRETAVLGMGGNRNKFFGFGGSQAVPASPSGMGEACGIRSILILKNVKRLQ